MQTSHDGRVERQQIIQAMRNDMAHDLQIHPLVTVHDNVAETDHLPHDVCQTRREPAILQQQIKQLRTREGDVVGGKGCLIFLYSVARHCTLWYDMARITMRCAQHQYRVYMGMMPAHAAPVSLRHDLARITMNRAQH